MPRFSLPDEDNLIKLRSEASELERWSNFCASEFGKYFIAFIDDAMKETMEQEDKFDVYKMEQHHILYQLASVRSKRQTLRAIKEKMVTADAKRQEIVRELNSYVVK